MLSVRAIVDLYRITSDVRLEITAAVRGLRTNRACPGQAHAAQVPAKLPPTLGGTNRLSGRRRIRSFRPGGPRRRRVPCRHLMTTVPVRCAGVRNAKGPRTIVFESRETIELKTPSRVDKSFLTIAGQTAPGDGICLKGSDVRDPQGLAHHRPLHSRPPGRQEQTRARRVSDAMTTNDLDHVIFDHSRRPGASTATTTCGAEGTSPSSGRSMPRR